MNNFNGKSILIIYPPRDKNIRTIHEKLCLGLKDLGFTVNHLDIENPPVYQGYNLYDKFVNIYKRNVRNNNKHIFIAQKRLYNKYYYSKLIELSQQRIKYDYILVIKPEEFSTTFIKKLSTLGNMMVGYIWDALRLYYKQELLKSRNYFHQLFSFDKNNIKDHPDLKMKFLTNYYIREDFSKIEYQNRKIDTFYIGSLAGTLPIQRRDWKLSNLSPYLDGNVEIKMYVSTDFLQNDENLVNDKMIQYITEATSIDEALEKTRNSRIIIDICRSPQIGLSFRFFEALLYENKIITNNGDIVNYDFYNPVNIMVVDFDDLSIVKEQWDIFYNEPYAKVDEQIVVKYGLENWVKNVFQIGEFIPIEP